MSPVPESEMNWRGSFLRRSSMMVNVISTAVVLCTVFAVFERPFGNNISLKQRQSDLGDEAFEQNKFQQNLLHRIVEIEDKLSKVQDEFSTKVSKMEEEASRFSVVILDLNNKIMQLEEKIAHHQPSYGEEPILRNNFENEEYFLDKHASSSLAIDVKFGNEKLKNVFSVAPPSTVLHESTAAGVEIQTRSSVKERGLQQTRFLQGSTSFNVCKAGVTLSPINELSDWEFNEDVSHKLVMIKGLSSGQVLNNVDSPQFKAACWILYVLRDKLQIDDKFAQTYALFIFVFSAISDIEESSILDRLLPDRVCDLPMFACNNRQDITYIDYSLTNFQPTGNIATELSLLRSLESLDLADFDLRGTIPTELALMSNLTTLKLTGNLLTGRIPSEIGKLSKLEELWLNRNQLTGVIPTEIAQCTKLHTLVLSQNSLEGAFPTEVAAMTSLKILEVMFNEITGPIPENFHQNYKKIRFTNNKLTGEIPNQIWSIQPLQDLWLGDNRLTGTISEHARNLTYIETIGLDGNLLTGTLPDIFESFKNLTILLLFNNKLSGEIPHSVWNENLNVIDLHDNQLTGTVPKYMCQKMDKITVDDSPWFNDIPNVRCDCCDEANCFISDSKTISVGEVRRASCPGNNVHNIEYFEEYIVNDLIANVTRTDFSGVDVKETKDFCFSPSGCYSIVKSQGGDHESFSYSSSSRGLATQNSCDDVQICETSIGRNHPRRTGMSRITQLVSSNLDIVLHDPDSPEYLAMCWLMTQDERYFEYEVCDGTLVQRYIMAIFYYSQSDSFSFDSFSSNHTCDWPGIECDVNNRFIEKLRLDNVTLASIASPGILTTDVAFSVTTTVAKKDVKLTGPIRKEFGRLSRLREIYLDGNNFSGTIDPIMLSNSPELEVFHANNNKFEGEFPMPLLFSEKLKSVSLYGNRFIGTIDDSTEYSKNLEHLNLGKNLLQGTIPSGFQNCKKLKYFDLGKNILGGTIPEFFGTSFEGLSTLKLNENKFIGLIPVINSTELQILTFHSNFLTGTIPAEISSLQKLKILSLHHNSLQGTIPLKFQELKLLEKAQFHNNLLTGDAPRIPVLSNDNFAYITDCGKISPLQCDSCTMCCDPNDADQKCRVDWNWNVILWSSSFVPVILTILVPIVLYLVIWKFSWYPTWFVDNCDPLEIYSDDSVYAFIFLPDLYAFWIQAIISGIQLWMFIAFVIASNANSTSTDWEFTIQCFGDGLECANSKVISTGWLHLGVLTMLHLGVDFIHGFRQLRKAIHLWDIRLLANGFRLVCLSGLALSTSILYNAALAETNTQMIVNAVILLFINDLDEKTLEVLYAYCPRWTEEKIAEVRQIMSKKTPRNGYETRELEVNSEDIHTIEKTLAQPKISSKESLKEASHEVEEKEEKQSENWI